MVIVIRVVNDDLYVSVLYRVHPHHHNNDLDQEEGDEESSVDADVLHAKSGGSKNTREAGKFNNDLIMIILAKKFIFVTPEPGEPGRCERFVGDLSELENTEQGGEPEQDHHGLHQDEPGFKVKSQGKLLLTVFIILVTLTVRVLPCQRPP